MSILHDKKLGNSTDSLAIASSESRLNSVKHILQELLPTKSPSFVGFSLNDAIVLAAYQDYPDCYVEHHDSPFHTLEIIDKGSINLHKRFIGDRKIEMPLSRGQMYFIPHQADYFLEIDDPKQNLSFTLLSLCPNEFKKIAEREFDSSINIEFKLEEPKSVDSKLKEIKRYVNLIKKEILANYPNGSLHLELLVCILINLLIKKFGVFPKPFTQKISPSPVNKKRLKEAMDYVEKHYQDDLSLEKLAPGLGLSISSTSRLFSEIGGISFVNYLKEVRMNQARKCLAETFNPIARIAQECGFNDASYFCKVFKSYTGLTPTQYRNEYGRKIMAIS
jgi:AraC-like DNA-binding protein